MTEDSKMIDEASNLATLRLLIFETANTYLKNKGIEPEIDTLRGITQRVTVEALRKLREASPDKAAFERLTEKIVANVLYEYGKSTNIEV